MILEQKCVWSKTMSNSLCSTYREFSWTVWSSESWMGYKRVGLVGREQKIISDPNTRIN